jgi:hypothetical protein
MTSMANKQILKVLRYVFLIVVFYLIIHFITGHLPDFIRSQKKK